MNFEKLNKLTFTTPNPNNEYVSWGEKEPTSPRYKFEYEEDDFNAEDIEDYENGLMEDFYRRVISLKTRIDEAVDKAVFKYVNDESQCCEDIFPRSTRMTGNYYISDENYRIYSDGIKVSVMTNFTEMFSSEREPIPYETDYLGLEVWIWINENDELDVYAIDSSSI